MSHDIACRIFLGGKKHAGKFALVDAEDLDALSEFKWYYLGGYAAHKTIPGARSKLMHKHILPCLAPFQIDHINGDTLDNRRCNLRIVTFRQNMMNRKLRCDSTSGFRGVSLCKNLVTNPWSAHIGTRVDGKSKIRHLGYFATAEEASAAYEVAALEVFGEYRRQ